MNEKNKPIREFRAGTIAASVWENKTEKGDYKTVSFRRGYKDKAGNWQDTNSLRIMDLPKAALVLTKAYEFLTMQKEEPAYP